MGGGQEQQYYPQAQPEALPSPPYVPESAVGRLLRDTATTFTFGDPNAMTEIRTNPTSMKSMAAYANAALAAAAMFGGARGRGGIEPKTGEPFSSPTVYHGTDADFASFSNQKIKQQAIAQGHFFADTPEAASKYGPNLLSAKVEFQNPAVIDAEGRNIRSVMGAYEEGLIRDAGHDGIIIKNVIDTPGWVMTTSGYQSVKPQTEYIAFDPSQIKDVYKMENQ